MKRDMEIIRRILLNAEDDKYPYGGRVHLDGVSDETCAYHVALILDAGLADGEVIKSTLCPYAAAMIHRLTPAGHDFCDGIRRDTIWRKVREHFIDSGKPIVFAVIVEYVKMEVRRLFP
jgi:hypothetical protein